MNYIENQNSMSSEQKVFCQNSPHLFWEKNKTSGIRSKLLRNKIYVRDKGICQICFLPLNLDIFTIDHKIPVSKGGINEEANLQLACRPCNSRKKDNL